MTSNSDWKADPFDQFVPFGAVPGQNYVHFGIDPTTGLPVVEVVGADGSRVQLITSGGAARIFLDPTDGGGFTYDPATLFAIAGGATPALFIKSPTEATPAVLGDAAIALLGAFGANPPVVTLGAEGTESVVLAGAQASVGPGVPFSIGTTSAYSIDARSAPRSYLDGVSVTTGALVGPVSAETNIPQMQLTAAVRSGRTYLIEAQLRTSVTVATDSWDIRLRRDNAVVGTQLAVCQFSGDATIGTQNMCWIFESAATETLNLFFSVARAAGTGTINAFGSPGGGIARTMASIRDIGANGDFRTA